MAFVAKLTHGSDELDLNTGLLKLGIDWVPPAVQLSANLARGSSANRFGGSSLVSTRASNRTITVPVVIEGTSEAEIRGALQSIAHMLSFAGDELYFEFNPNNNVGFEPLWGQFGANYRYEVVFAESPQLPQYPYESVKGGLLPRVNLVLNVKPYALGLQQRVGSATGGILEDTIGTVDGKSRGTIVPEATTNKMTNPIFGHGTWDNDWTAAGSLVATENTDPKFITHGKSSAKLVGDTIARIFTQSINVGNTNAHELSCYAKLTDGGVLSSSTLQLRYGSDTLSTTFTLIDDGWYRLTATDTGIASSQTVGVVVVVGRSVYIDGFQIEEKDYATPMAHGDLLGCAWTGTAHASTTTRTVARLSVPFGDVMDLAEGTIRIVWKADRTNTDMGSFHKLFDTTGVILVAFWRNSATEWAFQDDTNEINGASSQTFAVGDKLIFYFVYEPGSLKIFLNGAEYATGSTYTPPAAPADMYIGSSPTPSEHMNGTFMDFTTFAQAMTATEVSDDYTNILEQVEDDRRLMPIPWDWTKDGDDVLDNVDDDSRDNYHVASGIPGSAPAITRIKLTASTNRSGHTIAKTVVDQNEFRVPNVDGLSSGYQYYFDLGQTDDAAASDAKTDTTTVGTSEMPLDSSYSSQLVEPMQGEVHFFARIREPVATGNLQVKPFYAYDNTANARINGEWVAIDVDTTYKLFYLGSLNVRAKTILDPADRNLYFGLRAIRTSGSAAAYLDYFLVVPGEVMILKQPHAVVVPIFFTENKEVMTQVGGLEYIGAYTGEPIELTPEKYNIVWHAVSDQNDDSLLTSTTTIDELYVTPRWALL